MHSEWLGASSRLHPGTSRGTGGHRQHAVDAPLTHTLLTRALLTHRYTDEVRKVIKQCSEDVLAILQERQEAMWAGVKVRAVWRCGGAMHDQGL